MSKETVSYPQANNFNNVLQMVGVVAKNPKSNSKEIQDNLEWDYRAVNYYLQAGHILGLLDKDDTAPIHTYTISRKMAETIQKSTEEQVYAYIKTIMKIEVCEEAVRTYLKTEQLMSSKEFFQKMKEGELDVSEATLKRRASTLRNWSKWATEHVTMAF